VLTSIASVPPSSIFQISQARSVLPVPAISWRAYRTGSDKPFTPAQLNETPTRAFLFRTTGRCCLNFCSATDFDTNEKQSFTIEITLGRDSLSPTTRSSQDAW